MSILGTRVRRVEDPKFLTVGGTYTADLHDPHLDGAGHVTFVRSPVAHARVMSIDVEDAQSAPGVIGVFIAADLHGLRVPGTYKDFPDKAPDPMARPWLGKDVVRFVGEAVAVIVTEHPYQGVDAAELVIVDYEPLEAVVDPEHSVTDELVLFPAKGTNVSIAFEHGNSGNELFDSCEVVVSQRIVNQRLAACPLEVRAAAAVWQGEHLTLWCSTQSAHGVRKQVAAAFEIDESNVRVIAPDVGGGFGAKGVINAPEERIVSWLARELVRPMRWFETRSESMVAMPHGRGQIQHVEMGGQRSGKIDAYRLTVLQDAGAYPGVGAVLPFMTRAMAQGVYDIERVEFNSTSVVTNTTTIEAYRGAGRPEAAAAIERMVDLFAREINVDPVEVRRQNFIAPTAFPFETKTGATYDNGNYEQALDRALEVAGYEALRAEQAARRESRATIQIGIGIAVYVEVTAGPFAGETEYARVEVHLDGSATVFTGSSSHGQGHETSWAMLASDRLGIPMELISVVHGDTDRVPEGTGTWGSRSLQVGGSALVGAAGQLIERSCEIAAGLLEVDRADIVFDADRACFHAAGAPTVVRSWSEVVETGVIAEGEAGSALGSSKVGLSQSFVFHTTAPSFPFGAHIAVVEVDTETGHVELRRMITCDDAGRIINPVVVEGQRHGGIAQGVAQALLEEVRYDADGNPVTSNLADYAMISAAELPAFELVVMETPTDLNELGAKGIGESGTIGATPAVQNAVIDAVAHLGVRHIDLPCTPERVWRAINDSRGAGTSSNASDSADNVVDKVGDER